MSVGQVAELLLAIGEHNARPVQPLNGRVEVELDFGAGSATAPWPAGASRVLGAAGTAGARGAARGAVARAWRRALRGGRGAAALDADR